MPSIVGSGNGGGALDALADVAAAAAATEHQRETSSSTVTTKSDGEDCEGEDSVSVEDTKTDESTSPSARTISLGSVSTGATTNTMQHPRVYHLSQPSPPVYLPPQQHHQAQFPSYPSYPHTIPPYAYPSTVAPAPNSSRSESPHSEDNNAKVVSPAVASSSSSSMATGAELGAGDRLNFPTSKSTGRSYRRASMGKWT